MFQPAHVPAPVHAKGERSHDCSLQHLIAGTRPFLNHSTHVYSICFPGADMEHPIPIPIPPKQGANGRAHDISSQ